MDKQNGYLGDLIDTAIDVVQYQVDRWRNDNDGDITRDNIDNLLDQYHDEITGNDNGAAPTRIYYDDAEAYFKANADGLALLAWCKDCGIADSDIAEAYSGGDYNKLDMLESCRVYEANRDAIVDAVCDYYRINE